MADSSFYGGRPGFSFVIVLSYESVEEMINCFKQGPDYTTVHFDEYVLINTYYKDDPDNGKIFRRGYDYNNDIGGAIYIGTIVGPPGFSPMVEMTTVADVIDRYENEEHREHILSEGEYAPLYDLVPGKTDDGEYRDSIKWACCSIHTADNLKTEVLIGFIWPYLVVDLEGNTVSAYYNRDSDEAGFTNTDLLDRVDDESHPFWEKWHISVPKGIKGDTFQNFRVITASDTDGVESYDGQADDRANGREILVYDYYHYDKEEGGEPVTIYLGDYNMITGITISEDGTITIEYSHDDTLEYVNLFKWIKSIELDTTNGHFTIIYNYETEADGTPTKYETDLAWVSSITMTHEGKVTIHHITGDSEDLDEIIKWVDAITLDEDGTITIEYNTGEVVTWANVLKWITGVELTQEGDFRIDFNNGDESYTTHLTWVNDITFENDGTISVHYNDGTDDFTYANLIQWITSVELTEDGDFTISFNNGADDYTNHLVWVRNITLSEDGTVTIVFNDGTTETYDNILKWVTGVELTEDGHFTIDFNNGDDSYQTDIVWVTEVSFDEQGIVTVHFNNGTTTEYPNIKWITEISLDDDGSFHIGFNNGDEYDSNLVWVTEVSFDEQGIVTVHFNNGTTTEYPNIKWITEISLDDDGSFHIGFNNGDEYDSNLVWVTSLNLSTDGTITVVFNNGTEQTYDNTLKWITSVELTDNGHFTISFNNGDDSYETDIVWVSEVDLSADGTLTITYNNGTTKTFDNIIKWITDVSLSEDGQFEVTFNNGDSSYTTSLTWIKNITIADDGTITVIDNQDNSTDYTNYIKVLNDISINIGDTEGTGNQKVHVVYNTGKEEDIGEPLNYIMKMAMVDSDYHLLVWYSDPAKRQEIVAEGKNYTYDGEDEWFDLGSVKDESGILIGLNLSLSDYPALSDISAAIDYLNSTYPSGLTGTDLQGKVVTIGDDNNTKMFYAFNYDTKQWYYVGTLGVNISGVLMVAREDDSDVSSKQTDLEPGGIWFILED